MNASISPFAETKRNALPRKIAITILAVLLCSSLHKVAQAQTENQSQTKARELIAILDKSNWAPDALSAEVCSNMRKTLVFDWKHLATLGGVKSIDKIENASQAYKTAGPSVYVDLTFNKTTKPFPKLELFQHYTGQVGFQLEKEGKRLCIRGYSLSISRAER